MADDANADRRYIMTEEFPRDPVAPLLFDVASLSADIVSLRVVTIDSNSGQVVLWKWRPRQGKTTRKLAEE